MHAEPSLSNALLDDVFEWDVVNWSRALRWWTPALQQLGGGRALEIGARRGGPSLWLALNGFEVVCSDVRNPEATARPLHQKYGVADRIRYEQVSALDIPYSEAFDVIIFKSVLGAVGAYGRTDRIYEALRQMHRALRPGGWLLFAENLAGSPLHRWGRKKLSAWGSAWNYLRYQDLPRLFAPFDELHYESVGLTAGLGRTESQRRLLGRIDRLIDRFVPPTWRYVAVGRAGKL